MYPNKLITVRLSLEQRRINCRELCKGLFLQKRIKESSSGSYTKLPDSCHELSRQRGLLSVLISIFKGNEQGCLELLAPSMGNFASRKGL